MKNKKIKKSDIQGTSIMPRLAVYMSNKYMYAQLIDDVKGKTITTVMEKQLDTKGKKIEKAFALGELVAKKAQLKKVEKVVFDRGMRAYHGNVKAIAEGARKGGLKF